MTRADVELRALHLLRAALAGYGGKVANASPAEAQAVARLFGELLTEHGAERG